MNSLSHKLAKILTYITFPGFWVIATVGLIQPNKPSFFLISTLMYNVVPFAFILYMVYKKRFQSVQLATIKERKLAVPFSFICSLIFIVYLRENHAILTTLNWAFLVSLTILVQIIFLLLSFKISIHTMGFSTFATFILLHFNLFQHFLSQSLILQNFNFWLVLFAMVLCSICWARYKLKAHTPKEMIFGIAVGISLTFVSELLFILLFL